MGSIVAGVVEEAAFRGYLQGTIERRHGPVIAILVTGSIFGFAHFTHPEVTLVLLPYYLAVAAVYGALAYLTNSILPSLVLHAGGNMLSAFDLFHGRHFGMAGRLESTGPDLANRHRYIVRAFRIGGASGWSLRNLGLFEARCRGA